jgi:hypothetical protein
VTRLVLRFLNFPGLLLLALIGFGVQTSLFSFWPLSFLQPDIVLFIVIWAALRRSLWEGGWMVIFLSDFAELHSAAPQGSLMMTYMAVFLGVRGFSRLVVLPNIHSLVMVTLFASVFWKLSTLGVLYLLGAAGNQWRHTLLYLFPGAIVEGILSLWAYKALERYDFTTFKISRRDDQSVRDSRELDDELQFEGRGI